MDRQTQKKVLDSHAEQIRKLHALNQRQAQQLAELNKALRERPRTVEEDLATIPGRRLFYGFVGRQKFTTDEDGKRGDPITFLVSQDGPFIQTHYPMVAWRPTSPSGADNFGRWSPVISSPLPAQEVSNLDTIDLSWEMHDSGSSRNFQNDTMPPLFSAPGAPRALPELTLYAPNTTITFTPFYEDINFNAGATTDTTEGELVVMLPGYRIVNM